jgi:hypothetical protein
MRTGLEVRVIHTDDRLIELRIWASNGEFTAQANVYADADAPRNLAQVLRGFPVQPGDVREFQLGTFRQDVAGDGVHLQFYCTDSTGHAAVDVRVEARRLDRGRVARMQTASFCLPIEAAAVDAFVQQLIRMPIAVGAAAQLDSAP